MQPKLMQSLRSIPPQAISHPPGNISSTRQYLIHQAISHPPGNISSSSQSLPTYTSFLQPLSMSEGTNVLTYTYGSDENRIKAVQTGATPNTRYFFGDYEKDITAGVTKHIHYVSAGDGLIAIVIRENGNDTYYYTYTDHLGSIFHVPTSYTRRDEYPCCKLTL